jgi:hypothetical protein
MDGVRRGSLGGGGRGKEEDGFGCQLGWRSVVVQCFSVLVVCIASFAEVFARLACRCSLSLTFAKSRWITRLA